MAAATARISVGQALPLSAPEPVEEDRDTNAPGTTAPEAVAQDTEVHNLVGKRVLAEDMPAHRAAAGDSKLAGRPAAAVDNKPAAGDSMPEEEVLAAAGGPGGCCAP